MISPMADGRCVGTARSAEFDPEEPQWAAWEVAAPDGRGWQPAPELRAWSDPEEKTPWHPRRHSSANGMFIVRSLIDGVTNAVGGIYRRQEFDWNRRHVYRRTGSAPAVWLLYVCSRWVLSPKLHMEGLDACGGLVHSASFNESLPEESTWLSDQLPGMPVLTIHRILPHGTARSAGNPLCWHNAMSFDLCCHHSYGKVGLEACWDGLFSFARCCHQTQPLASA